MVAVSSGCEQLLKVTKRHANVQVVELEFEGDATVPVYVPTVRTKGRLPPPDNETIMRRFSNSIDLWQQVVFNEQLVMHSADLTLNITDLLMEFVSQRFHGSGFLLSVQYVSGRKSIT